MAFKRVLTDAQEEELVEEYTDGHWSINDISVIFKVSHRTVYRVLAKHDVKRKNKRTRKRRVRPKPPKVLQPCGTNAAYQRHRENKEYPCTPCLEAHAYNVWESRNKGKNNNGTHNS